MPLIPVPVVVWPIWVVLFCWRCWSALFADEPVPVRDVLRAIARGEEITQVTARAMDERGLVSWSVELPPLGRRAVTLEYRVRSQRGVAGM